MMSSFRSGVSSMSLSALPVGSRRSAGGTRTVRVSQTGSGSGGFDLASLLSANDGVGGGFSSAGNEKVTMQNLNDRLAAYLAKVRSLESANAKLELQIREWYENHSPTVVDYSKYEALVQDLRSKISLAAQDNARLLLQIDNARLASDDFKIKYENELAVRLSVEADIAGLRKVLDELTVARSDLEMQVEGLREEMVYLKKNHAEEIAALHGQINSSSVNVEVDAKPQDDLNMVLDEIRSQYEGITDKNRREMEAWYKTKFDELNKEVATKTESLQTFQTEIQDLKRTLQALQIDLQSQLSLKSALEGQLVEVESRYNLTLSQLQALVNGMEEELRQVRLDIERQSQEYQVLLDIKTRLEMEIAEYRRLLDGEEVTTTVTVVETPKHQPVISQRRKVVIEELVDGKVVSRTEDVDTSIISQ